MDFGSAVIEEISLEGLDGITLSALWLRLETRKPSFPMALDDRSKQFLWNTVIVPQTDLEFHMLVEPRPPLVIYSHPDMTGLESDAGKKEPQEERIELYPFHPIRDKDIVGSCATYSTRKNISEKIRQDGKAKMTLKQAEDSYGEKLVIVASQRQRMRAILTPAVGDTFTLSDRIYCLLERVARARYIGSVTHGKYCLKSWISVNSKTLFYMRKKLCILGVITSQVFTVRNNPGSNTTGKLLHLKKFFVETKSLPAIYMEKITAALAKRPNKMEVKFVLLEELNINSNSFKKIYNNGPRYHEYVAIETRLTKEMFPDAEASLHLYKSKAKERQVQVIRLLKPYVYSVSMEEEEEEEEEDPDEDGDLDETALPNTAAAEESSHAVVNYEQPLLRQMYQYVLEQGEFGLSQRQLKVGFNLSRFDARTLCRNLDRANAAYKLMHDVGRQREQRFVAAELLEKSRLHKELIEEKKKILDHCKALQDSKNDEKAGDSDKGDPEEEASLIKGAVCTMIADKPSTSACPYDTFGKQMRPSVGLTESVLSMDEKGPKSSVSRKGHVTMRMLKRANMVMDAIRDAKVIDNLFYLQRRILEEERKSGVPGNIDKRSLYRIIKKLEKDGHIKVFRSTMLIREQEKHVTLWCDPSLTANCNLVKSTIESAFHKLMALTKMEKREASQSKSSQCKICPSIQQHESARTNHALLKSSCKVKDLVADNDAGRRYGFLPRMKRYQVIHEFIWYLVRGYGQPMNTPGGDSTLAETLELPADTEPVDLPIRVYAEEYSWRRFIPPLPSHKGYPEGWFLVGDVLLLLPVSIFVQIIRFNYKCAELEEYLNHPIKKWVMVCHLPDGLRNSLMYERRYVFQFFNTITDINHMGLFTFGKREFKEKEQIFVYIHANASIVDTTELSVPKHERSIKRFHFSNAYVVRDFWFSLQWICMNTFFEDVGYTSSVESRKNKDHFRETEQSRTPDEIVDDGSIPGNRLGAGGLDTYFFSHLKRNWMYRWDTSKTKTCSSSAIKKTPTAHLEELVQSAKKSKLSKERHSQSKDQSKTAQGVSRAISSPPADSQSERSAAAKRSAKSGKSPSIQTMTVKGIKPQKGGKGIKRKRLCDKFYERKRKRLFSSSQKQEKSGRTGRVRYDQRDIEAINRMTRERADWSSKEDSMLLLWKVTLTFLGGWRRDSIVSYALLRDELHRTIPESRNKTSSACQRRLIHMLKREETEYNVRMYVGEALQDKALVKEFLEGKTYKKNHTNTFSNAEIAVKCFEKLRQKFINNTNRLSVKLPDTLDDIHNKYTVHKCQVPTRSVHRDVRSRWDIEFTVLHNLIHCAILLDDKTGRAHELYHLFNQYSEELVNHVFSTMKSDRIVTRIKASVTRKSKLHVLPSVSMGTYHLSQRYTFFWVSKFPRTIFQHTYEVFNPLCELAKGTGDMASGEHQWVLLEGIAGSAALIIGLLTCNKLVFETTLPVEIVTVDGSKPVTKKSRHVEKTLSDEEEEAKIEEVEKTRPRRAVKPNSEHVNTSSSILTTPSRPSKSQEASSVLLTNSASGTTHRPPATRNALSLSQNQLMGARQPSAMNDTSDNLVVNTCVVRVRLKQAQEEPPICKWDFSFIAAQEIAKWNKAHVTIHPKTCAVLLSRLRSLQPKKLDREAILSQLLEDSHCTQEEVSLMNTIHSSVKQGELIGLTIHEIRTELGDHSRFDWCLNMLVEKKIVVRVGVVVFRYVSHEHVRPWLINSCKNVKGRGVHSEQDESDDLMLSMTLKDFPGVPVLPEDYAIRPGKPQLSVSGGKIVERIAKDDLPARVDQPTSDNSQVKSAKQLLQTQAKQVSSESSATPDSAVSKAASESSKAITRKPLIESSKTKPVVLVKNILLKTVLPDDKVIREQLISADDIDVDKHILKRKHTEDEKGEAKTQSVPGKRRKIYLDAPSTTVSSTSLILTDHQSSMSGDLYSGAVTVATPTPVTSTSTVASTSASVSSVQSSPATSLSVKSTTSAAESFVPVTMVSIAGTTCVDLTVEESAKVQGSAKVSTVSTASLLTKKSPARNATSTLAAPVRQATESNSWQGIVSPTSKTSSTSPVSNKARTVHPNGDQAASTMDKSPNRTEPPSIHQGTSPKVISSPVNTAARTVHPTVDQAASTMDKIPTRTEPPRFRQMTSPRVITSPVSTKARTVHPNVDQAASTMDKVPTRTEPPRFHQGTSPRVITSPVNTAARTVHPNVDQAASTMDKGPNRSEPPSIRQVTSPKVITSPVNTAARTVHPSVDQAASTMDKIPTRTEPPRLNQATSPRVITSPVSTALRTVHPSVDQAASTMNKIPTKTEPPRLNQATSPRVITSPLSTAARTVHPNVDQAVSTMDKCPNRSEPPRFRQVTSPRVTTSPSRPATRGAVVCNVGSPVQNHPQKEVLVTPKPSISMPRNISPDVQQTQSTSFHSVAVSTVAMTSMSTAMIPANTATSPSVKTVPVSPSSSKRIKQTPVCQGTSRMTQSAPPKSSRRSAGSTAQPQKIRLKLPSHMSTSDVDVKSIMKHVQKLMASGKLTPGKICVKIPDQPAKGKDATASGSKASGAVVIGQGSSTTSPSASSSVTSLANQSTPGPVTKPSKSPRQQSSGILQGQSHPPQLDGCWDNDDTFDLIQVDGAGDRPSRSKGKSTAHRSPKSSARISKPELEPVITVDETIDTNSAMKETSMDITVEEVSGVQSSKHLNPEISPDQRSDSPPQSPGTEAPETPQSLRAPSARIRKKKTTGQFRVPQAKSTYQPVLLVCRPWKTPEGTVNRSILQMMLEGLMLHIIQKPGISKAALEKKYSPILQPVPLMELLEMLQIIGCVEQDYLKQNRPPTLFSTRSTYVKMDRDEGNADHLFTYRPTQTCVIKLGRFVAQMQHTNKTS